MASTAHTSAAELAAHFGPSPTLLAVWAHPDDESYLGAGLMAEVVRSGGRVVNVCATAGELGSPDPNVPPDPQLASTRRTELQAALAALGVHESIELGYRDGECATVPVRLAARRLGVVIDEVRPDVVLSFGPDGVTGHADHRAVARWAALAVSTGRVQIPLLAAAAHLAWPLDVVAGMHRVDAFLPGHPRRGRSTGVSVVGLDDAATERKLAALHAHGSQIGPLLAELGHDGYRRLAAVEAYRPANRAAAGALAGTTSRLRRVA